MSKINILATAAALALMTALPQVASAGGELTIYPYASKHNYCPAGLQPVSVGGNISCGKPNTHVSYQSAKAHHVARRSHHATYHHKHHARHNCAVGTKGCTYD